MNTDQKLNALSKAVNKSLEDHEVKIRFLRESLDLRDVRIKKLEDSNERLHAWLCTLENRIKELEQELQEGSSSSSNEEEMPYEAGFTRGYDQALMDMKVQLEDWSNKQRGDNHG